MVPTHSRLEAALLKPALQRAFTVVFSAGGLASAAWMTSMLVAASGMPGTEATDPLSRRAELASEIMLIAMLALAGALGLYLAAKGHRRTLPRLLGSACAGLAGMGILFGMRLYFAGPGHAERAIAARHSMEVIIVLFLVAVFAMAVWMFSVMKFLVYFPKPVTLLDQRFERRSLGIFAFDSFGARGLRPLLSAQSAALAIGLALIAAIDASLDRLTSELWNDASLYLLCWGPFAIVSAKQRLLVEEDRRAIRWVLLGQTLWLAVFLASCLALIALLGSDVLKFANWNDSSAFAKGFFGFFYAGFVIALMLALAVSIFYDGTLDPDLIIRRTWLLAAVGLISGSLFVVLERLLATAIAGWLNVSAVNALTIVAAITAAFVYPARHLIETRVKGALERWHAANAIADGVRREAVIVFADLSGYTALTERNEREALIMAAIFHRDAQRIGAAQGGKLIKTIGDAVMLSFPEVDAALRAVIELKRAFREHVTAMSMEPLMIHAALHHGEVVESPSGDVFGSTVNLAARLLGAAGTHDIVASRAALERASQAQGAEFIGSRTFKNVSLPVDCFRVPEPAGA